MSNNYRNSSSSDNNNNNNNTKTMSTTVMTKKASVLGTWHEDVFTDELLKKIAAYAAAEKGKKAKVKLSGAGLRITRSRFLQADTSQFFAIQDVKTVTRNPNAPSCVLFILADARRKYQIVGVRCASDVDAQELVSFTGQIKKDQQVSNVEFRKRDNGNWTLRERSAHNAHRQLVELFNQQTNGEEDEGNAPARTTFIETSAGQNGSVTNHVPVLDASRNSAVKGSYIKRQHSSSLKKKVKDSEDGEYVVVTEVETGEQSDDVRALKGRVTSLTHELNEIKAMLHQNNSADEPDAKEAQPGQVSAYSHSAPVSKAPEVLPSRPQVYTATNASQSQRQPVVYRSPPKTYEARRTGPTYYVDPWGSQRRVSGSFTVPSSARSRTDSIQGSTKVTFDTQSIASNTSRKSKSLRLHSSIGSIPTTIERSIEDTYARPVVMRRQGSVQLIGPRSRPVSYHVRGNRELKVFDARGRSHDDVAL